MSPFYPTDTVPDISIQDRVETDGREICVVGQQVLISNEILEIPAFQLFKSPEEIYMLVFSTLSRIHTLCLNLRYIPVPL